MPDDVIQSPDTLRTERLPRGHTRTVKWPELPPISVPKFDVRSWDLAVFPAPIVEVVKRFTWHEFGKLPRVKVFADMHFETGYSRLDNLWEGVATRELLKHSTLASDAKFVMVHGEHGTSANLSLIDFFAEDALFAVRHDGMDLRPELGQPLRLIVPRLLAWKNVKWVRGIEFMNEDRPGVREGRDLPVEPTTGDPWDPNHKLFLS